MRLKDLDVPGSKECRNAEMMGTYKKEVARSLRRLLLAKYGTI